MMALCRCDKKVHLPHSVNPWKCCLAMLCVSSDLLNNVVENISIFFLLLAGLLCLEGMEGIHEIEEYGESWLGESCSDISALGLRAIG